MDKPHKKNNLHPDNPRGIHFIAGVLVIIFLTAGSAFFATSAVQADAIFPASQPAVAKMATFPQFTVAPQPPRLLQADDQDSTQPLHRFSNWLRGVASWYGPSFNGHIAANGTVFDMYAMTAATTEFHPELPLGTKVRVIDGHTGRSVVVRITDRGPLPRGRILDLSYGAARKLAMVKPGVARVRVHVLRWGKDRYHHPQLSEPSE